MAHYRRGFVAKLATAGCRHDKAPGHCVCSRIGRLCHQRLLEHGNVIPAIGRIIRASEVPATGLLTPRCGGAR